MHYALECSGAPNALNEAARMVNRGGRICLAAFPAEPVPVDLAYLVRNNIYIFGIRGEGNSATHRAAALMAQAPDLFAQPPVIDKIDVLAAKLPGACC